MYTVLCCMCGASCIMNTLWHLNVHTNALRMLQFYCECLMRAVLVKRTCRRVRVIVLQSCFMQTHPPRCGLHWRQKSGARENKRRWLGCRVRIGSGSVKLVDAFLGGGQDELDKTVWSHACVCGGGHHLFLLFSIASIAWAMAMTFIWFLFMCWLHVLPNLTSTWAKNAFLQSFYFINPQMIMPKSFLFLSGPYFWQTVFWLRCPSTAGGANFVAFASTK